MFHSKSYISPMGKAMGATALCSTLLMAVSVAPVMAAEEADDALIEEIVTLGSRSNKPRSATDSPVPIDVISGNLFNSGGNSVDSRHCAEAGRSAARWCGGPVWF